MRYRDFSIWNPIGAIIVIVVASASSAFGLGWFLGLLWRCARAGFELVS